MGYTPAFNATFSKPLLNQLIAVIQRDQAAALAIVNSSLSPISEFHKGPGARTSFPWLMVTANTTAFDAQTTGTRRSVTKAQLALDVGQYDQEFAQDNGQDYARMLDMVVTTASLADWTAPLAITLETVPGGTTTPPQAAAVKDVFVASHAYDVVTVPEVELPVLRVTITVVFDMEET
ncbi:MAG TPA: hypothetical protein VKU44_10655 [Terriglobia bacterium]|nr:hypothetical protein [Terriglobia bacterium]